MNDKSLRDIAEIEDAQAGLRECIEAAKELAERADDVLQKHRVRAEHADARRD